MNRRRRTATNTIAAVANQIVAFACSFVLSAMIIKIYGSKINGLIQSISQFLGFVILLDMGVSTVVQSSLYRPIALEDDGKVSEILSASNRFFKIITIGFAGYTVLLSFFYPQFVESSLNNISTALLVVSISISSIVDYLIGITNQVLLNASQKAYIQFLFRILTNICNLIIALVLMNAGCSIVLVKLISSCIFMIRPTGMLLYVKHNYNYDSNIKYVGDPIPQRWNGLAHHISSFVFGNTDIVILTLFSSLESVSIYSVYVMILSGLNQAYATMLSGIHALFGDMYARNESKNLKNTFQFIEWISHMFVTVVFTDTGLLLVNFVLIYTSGVKDTNYSQPVFSLFITMAYAVCCLKNIYNILVVSAGKFKETQLSSIIQALLNVGISIILVSKLGIVGLAIGTLVAVCYQQIYYYYYLHHNIVYIDYGAFLKLFVTDLISIALIVVFSKFIVISNENYIEWAKNAAELFFTSVIITFSVNAVVHKKNVVLLRNNMGKIWSKR